MRGRRKDIGENHTLVKIKTKRGRESVGTYCVDWLRGEKIVLKQREDERNGV